MTSTTEHLHADQTLPVLNYAHQLLLSKGKESVADFSQGLAQAFGVRTGGMIAYVDGLPIFKQLHGAEHGPVPWEKDPQILREASQEAMAFCPDGAMSWLFVRTAQPGGAEWLIWVMDPEGRTWSRGERAGLTVVAQALTRLVLPRTTPLADRLENERIRRSVAQGVHVVGRLAHDFGNFLTGILGFTELALSQLADGSLPQRYLKEVLESARKGAGWVHKLQVLSRRQLLPLVPTDLAALVREEGERLVPLWGSAISLVTRVAPGLPPLGADRESVRQILEHLLDNAREAISDQEGTITLSARAVELDAVRCDALLGSPRPGTYVEITVTDTGKGLPAEFRERLFADIFFSTKPRHRGLGLVTVFWLVQLYEGGLGFDPHPERGTAVHVFLLPAAATSPAPVTEKAAGARRGTPTRPRAAAQTVMTKEHSLGKPTSR
jgi:signal transduction histidine kinase